MRKLMFPDVPPRVDDRLEPHQCALFWLDFRDSVSWSSGWPQTQHVTKDDLGLSIFLPLLPEYCDHKQAPSSLIDVVLGSNPLSSLAWPEPLSNPPVSA